MDRLNGILINGFLGGNMLLGAMNLAIVSITVEERPIFEPSGVGAVHGRNKAPKTEKYIIIRMELKGNQVVKEYKITDTTAIVSVKMINIINKVKDITVSIGSIFTKNKKVDNIEIRPMLRDNSNIDNIEVKIKDD